MYPHQGVQGQQHPQHWDPQSPNRQPQPNGAYAQGQPGQVPPPQNPQAQQQQQQQGARPLPEMAAMHAPQQQNMYPLPGPTQLYGPPDQYRAQYMNAQPAPRQRTAIACRYCRRRKIRCSGFDTSEEGRCTNCQRFQQECIFTPVSSQAQAFVPAHAANRYRNQPLYGAYGQPLPPQQQDAYAPARGGSYTLPSPTAQYGPGPAYAQQPYDDPAARDSSNKKRPADEPHTPTLPPPNPATTSMHPGHRGSGGEFTYPDPTNLTPGADSPASSAASFHSNQPHPHAQPYYTAAPAHRRNSPPGSAYSYDLSRPSSSPHNQGFGVAHGPGGYVNASSQTTLHPQNMAIREGRTPPPSAHGQSQGTQTGGAGRRTGSAAGAAAGAGAGAAAGAGAGAGTGNGNGAAAAAAAAGGMSIRDIVDGGRSAADSNMLSSLNRRAM